MFLTGKIKTLISTGSPDYIICGQATGALSLTNMSFKLAISKSNGTVQSLIDTTDLSTISGLIFDTYNYGNYDIKFTSFVIDTITSTFQLKIEVFYKGTTDVVTWEKFNLFLDISKVGYQSFRNTFELYNYDIGNASSVAGITDTTGNEDFEVILTNNTNNLDIYNRQTKVGSNLLLLRKPFTKEVHFYNMIGSQGDIVYTNNSVIIGEGNSGYILEEADVYIEQIISLISDDCTSGKMILGKEWFPKFVTSYISNNTCDNCTNNLAETISSFYYDATNTSTFNIHGVPYFLSEFMSNKITTNIVNYKSEITDTNESLINLTYALWLSNPNDFLNPIDFSFIPEEVGENVINIINLYYYNSDPITELYKCITNYILNTCNWWTVTNNEDCNSYTIKNCSSNDLTVVLQLLDENKVFQDVSTNILEDGEELELTLSTDGVYMLKVSSDDIEGYQYYSLPVYCNLQACILSYLNYVLCNKVTSTNCKEETHYNFNSLLITAHSYFLLLNQEMNYNFIYTSLPLSKVEELYTIKTFIDRFSEYCDTPDSLCLPCNK